MEFLINMLLNNAVTFDLSTYQGRKIEATPLSMYNFFIERVKKNLHIVLAMSPIGDAFRNRLRMFPSLINCCTIDWFQVRLIYTAQKVKEFIRIIKFIAFSLNYTLKSSVLHAVVCY